MLVALKVSNNPELVWDAFRRTLKAPDLLDFLHGLARADGKPTIVVLDNASMHKNTVVWAARAACARGNRQVRHHPRPERISQQWGAGHDHDRGLRHHGCWW